MGAGGGPPEGSDAALLSEGLAHHQAGRLADAATLYAEILKAAPDNADALHLSGVIALQKGDYARAVELIGRAIAIDATQPPFYDNLGVALRYLGSLDEAEAAHRKALELDPDFAAAHHNLGTTLHTQGRFIDAEASAKRSLELNPANAEALNTYGNILRATGRNGQAVKAYHKSLALNPGLVMAQMNLGAALRELGDLAGAEAALNRALEMDPNSADVYNNLGNVYVAQERKAKALAAFRRAVELVPKSPLALSNMAAAMVGEDDLAGGEATFRKALSFDANCTEALNGLGVVLSNQGRSEDSLATFRRALAVKPDYVEVYYNMANLRHVAFTPDELANIARLLKAPHIKGENRARLYFSLAEHFSNQNDRDAAFENYRLGNESRHLFMAEQGKRFDAQDMGQLIEKRMAFFTPEFFERRRDFGDPSARPVFVVGMPRSGTTLIEQIAASHSSVFGAGELRDAQMLCLRRLGEILKSDKAYPEIIQDMTAEISKTLAGEYLDKINRMNGDAARLIDKMPFNYLHLGFIRLLFPNARVIHCRRDGRDVGLSCYFQNFNDPHPWTTRLEDIGAYFRNYQTMMAFWKKVLPMEILDVDYESLIEDQERESRRIIEYLGLEWEDACLQFHKTERAVRTASNWQVRQPIYTTSVAKWKAYEAHIQALLEALEGQPGAG